MEQPRYIGKYEILGLIGKGGMGCVYRARDSILDRLVALKVISSEISADNEIHSRFLREARAVAALQHANIVVVHELGQHQGDPFIAMEFLDGEPLDRVIRDQKPLTNFEKCGIVVQVANALHYAHEKGVIHRDVKPANIMRMNDGSVKVVDFGIVHLADQTITKSGMVLGTLNYLAPEQLNGEGIDRRTDIFSLGVVLYQLLSGRLPFEGASTAETMMKILMQPAPAFPSIEDSTPREFQLILDKALAKKRDDRFQTCLELATALGGVKYRLQEQRTTFFTDAEVSNQGEHKPHTPTTIPEDRKRRGSFPQRLILVIVAAAVLIGSLSFYLWRRSGPSPVTTPVVVVEKHHDNLPSGASEEQQTPSTSQSAVAPLPLPPAASSPSSSKAPGASFHERSRVQEDRGSDAALGGATADSAIPKQGAAAKSATNSFMTRLIVKSKAGELQVNVDGTSVGTARPENPFTRDLDPQLPHEVRITKSGYSDFVKQLDATKADAPSAVVLSPDMTPLGASSPVSSAAITRRFKMLYLAGPSQIQFQYGYLILGKGSIRFEDDTGTHSFEVPFTQVVEAKNDSNLGTGPQVPYSFHIRLNSGQRYQFALLDTLSRVVPPDNVVNLINQARPQASE
jgi:serine/threonine protein kinase